MSTTVTSKTNPLAYAKAIATLVGTIATGLLGVYASDTPAGQVLTILAIVATAITTWAVPNAEVVKPGEDTYPGAYDGEDGDVEYVHPDNEPVPYDPDAPVYTDGPTPYTDRGDDPARW